MRHLLVCAIVGATLALVGCGESSSGGDVVVKGKKVSEWVTRARDSDPSTAVEAFSALSDFEVRKGDGATIAVGALSAALTDEKWNGKESEGFVRSMAADAIAKFGEKAKSAVPALERALQRPDVDGKLHESLRSALVAVAPNDEPIERRRSRENLEYLAKKFVELAKERPWPRGSGRAFVLSLVASGQLERSDGDLGRLFSPADKTRSLESAGGASAYGAVNRESLSSGMEVEQLTSYVGRRNSEKEHIITSTEGAAGTPILADLSFDEGVLVGYSNGTVKWHSRAELGVSSGETITVGDRSKSPLLRDLGD